MSSAGKRTQAVALVATLALGACKGKSDSHKDKPADTTTGEIAGLAACRDTLAKIPALPPHQRVAALLRGCPVCGPSFEPLIHATSGHPDLVQVDAIMSACKTGCTKSALSHWRTLLSDTVPGQGVQRPWRALADDCPAVMRADPGSLRFAGAPWFALAMIGARLHAAGATLPPSVAQALASARAAVVIPMPPATQGGTGLVVPPGTARDGIPWRAVTVTDQALLLGHLAIGRLDGDGWHVDGAARPYPGPPLGLDAAAELAALGPARDVVDRVDDVLVIAPRAAPATRALAALMRLAPAPTALAVSVPDTTSLWRGAVAAHALTIAPATGPRLRLDLVAGRVAAVAADGTVRRSAALPAAATRIEQVRAGLTAVAGHPLELVPAVPGDLDVAGLVELLDVALAAGATSVAIASAGADTSAADAGPLDARALAAALAVAPAP